MLGAVDIGGSKIAAAAVRPDGVIAARRSCPTGSTSGPDDAADRIASLLRECISECRTPLAGVGIGCTGPVDPFTGILGNVDLLPGWSGYPLVDRLQQKLGVGVAMENDADAAALAEAAWGAGRGAQRFLYVTVGTGIGTALIIDGQPYRGAGSAHPEAGHHTIDLTGPRCYCGAHGCWESLASGPAMAAASLECGSAREICDRARAGDADAQRAVDREAYYLGLGLANLIAILCPDRVALGGGVMESAGLFLPGIRGTVAARCGLIAFDPARITPAALGADAPLLGAARVWQYRIPEVSKARSCV